jgi:hypothetical protein
MSSPKTVAPLDGAAAGPTLLELELEHPARSTDANVASARRNILR